MEIKTSDILLVIIIVILLLQISLLTDLRSILQSDCTEEIPDKAGELHREKQEQPDKPGKLIPNPRITQWGL